MVRISDSRMSGTSYGTCVLHVTPEAAVGGPLALVTNPYPRTITLGGVALTTRECTQVKDGDLITLDVPNRNLQVLISDEEMEARRAAWQPCAPTIPNRLVSQIRELSKQRGLMTMV